MELVGVCALCVPWLSWQIGFAVRTKWGESGDRTLSSVGYRILGIENR